MIPIRKRLHFLLPLLFLLLIAKSQGQSDHATITGTVTDTSGAVLPEVQVTATNLGTAIRYKAVSNDLGFYSLLNLPVGSYAVQFDKQGFKALRRTGLILLAGHTDKLDASLEVGSVSETVTVSGTPVLEMQTEVGTNINSQVMTDLPLTANGGRDITTFAFAIAPNVSGSGWSSHIAGSQAFTKSVTIDGTSTDSGIVGQVGESQPSMEAIGESQINTVGLRAEDGRSGGGSFMFTMKSGTNRWHGSVLGILANEILDANTWDNKWWQSYYTSQNSSNAATYAKKYQRAKNRYFDYGFSGGGPIWKDRTFFYAAYEKYMQSDWRTNPTGSTVPTTKMLDGDFSELLSAISTDPRTGLACTAPCPILNSSTKQPYTDAAGNTIYYNSIFQPNGTVYPGNIIPSSQISALSQKIASYYKQYYKPTTAGISGNYPSLSANYPWFHQTQFSIKVDHNLNSNDHIASSYIYNLRPRTYPCISSCGVWQAGTETGGPLSNGVQQTVISNEYRVSETHIFTSNLINVAGFTFNQFQNKSVPMTTVAGGTNWASELGFSDIDKLKIFPHISFSGSPNGFGEKTIGNYYTGGYVAYNGIFNDSISWVKGRHNLKFGTEIRALGFNNDTVGGALNFTFSNNTFAPTNTAIQSYVGSAFANFMLGEVQSANQGVTFNLYSRRKELSFFVQDDIKVTPKFTVSADLRWELTRPLRVLNGSWTNFDINSASQAFGGINGAVTWLKHSGDSFETYTDWHQLAPHLGGSYQVSDKIVVRGSAGINFVPLGNNGYSGTPYGSAVGYTGVNEVKKVSAQAAAFQWDSSKYPGTYVAPTGANPSSTYIPWGPAYVDPHTRQLAFTENWFAGVQYQLLSDTKIEVSYIGNSGRNLHDGALNPKNYPSWSTYQKLLNSGHVWDWVWDAGSAAKAGVPYPYAGFSGSAYFAINPYPQVQSCYCGGVFFTNTPIGKSGYNALTIEGIKRGKGALNFDLSYNFSRTTGNTDSAFIDTWSFGYGFQDPYKYDDEARYARNYHTVKGYLTYELPFGSGRKFLNHSRILDYVVKGWTAGTLVSYSSGDPMSAIGSTNSYPGWSGVYTNVAAHPNFKNTFKRVNLAWNPTVSGSGTDTQSLYFDPSNFSNPTFGTLGNSPRIFTNWHKWAAPSEDASLLKKFRFGADGRFTATLRAEFFNVFNRHYWGNPNTTFGSGWFGHVTSVSGNRTGQIGARFEW